MQRLLIGLLLVAVASATTTITYNIRNDYGLELLAAFEAQADSHCTITFRGSQNAEEPDVPDYAASIDFRIPTRDPGYTDAQYVKRIAGLIIDAVKIAHEAKLQNDIRDAALAEVPIVDVDEPNEIGE